MPNGVEAEAYTYPNIIINCQTSSLSCTKSKNLNVSRLVL